MAEYKNGILKTYENNNMSLSCHADIKIKDGDFGLANIASTITTLFDIKKNPVWLESIIEKIKY